MDETDKSDKQDKRIKRLIEKKHNQAKALRKILEAFEKNQHKSNKRMKK